MRSNKTWQQLERYAATIFGTTRNPLSGANNRSDDGSKRIGDVITKPGDRWFAECKHYARFAIKTVFESAQLDDPDKTLFLFAHTKGQRYEDSLVIMRASVFNTMWPHVAHLFHEAPER
jgi:hypothetical protein